MIPYLGEPVFGPRAIAAAHSEVKRCEEDEGGDNLTELRPPTEVGVVVEAVEDQGFFEQAKDAILRSTASRLQALYAGGAGPQYLDDQAVWMLLNIKK